MCELTKQDLNSYKDYLTVGNLKKFLIDNNLPDDALVLIQRVEDFYYEKNNWKTYNKKGFHTIQAEKWNKDIKDKFLDEDQYPKLKDKKLVPFTNEEIKKTKDRYTPAFTCAKYDDDDDILFINLHY